MPQIYNGSQSPLEYFALNGRPEYAGSGRLAIIQSTKIGETKYTFQGPYKNPDISGTQNTKYSALHTNARADALSPYNGKGTGNNIDISNTENGVTARHNWNGGSVEDINGIASLVDSGRNKQYQKNAGLWGYGPGSEPNAPAIGSKYVTPNTSLNIGQVVI